MGPYIPPPHAAAKVPESLMGPCTASPLLLSSIATLCCHVPLSGLFTLLVCYIF
ncbi:unnamed protein product, partial [Staurois parvus]